MKKRIAALVLAGVMVFSGAESVVLAADTDDAASVDKVESVYVDAKANGTVKKIQVTDVLKNQGKSGDLQDYSELTDIQNKEGEETYQQASDGSITWQNLGEDITYEGKSDKELPVTVKVRYYLDGKEMKAKEMAGVSGKVKIRFEYKNQTSEKVDVDGKNYTVPVPFTVISAMMLPNDTFSNVKVKNGKVIEQNGQSVVIGMGFPGLADSLKLASYEPTKEVELPDYVEMTADVKDFKLDFTASVVTSGMFSELDEDDLKDAEDLPESMEKLTDASSELVDGTKALADGLKEMQSYMGEYTDGVSAVNEGVTALNDALTQLESNSDSLKSGTKQISDGIGKLDSALGMLHVPVINANLDGTAGKVQTDAETLKSQVAAIKTQLEAVKSAAENLDTSVINEEARNQAKAELEKVLSQMTEAGKITEESKNEIQDSMEYNTINVETAVSGIKSKISEMETLVDQTVQNGGNLSVENLNQDLTELQTYTKALSGLSESTAVLNATLDELRAATAQLKTGSEAVTAGISAYTEGVSQVNQGAKSLGTGSGQLVTAGGQLSSGMTSLLQGGQKLAEGMDKFDKDGIKKLGDLAGEDLNTLLDRVKAVKKADESYQSYSGIKEGSKGEVKFIIETAEIKAD